MKRITRTILPLTLSLLVSELAQSQTSNLNAVQSSGQIVVSRAGSRSVAQAPAANFTGVARVEMLFGATSLTRAAASSVTFEPGSRTAWHTHPRGQTLIVTSGLGARAALGRTD